jgi:L-ectoine synthase
MIVVNSSDLQASERDASGPGWSSLRMLVKSDKMGFSMNKTIVKAGASLTLQYKNHLEGCYSVSGSGRVTDHATGEEHEIKQGVLYALDQHYHHTLMVNEGQDMFLISVFNPALQGDEVHAEDGSYSA